MTQKYPTLSHILVSYAKVYWHRNINYCHSILKREHSLFVGNDVNTGIIKGGGLGKEWSNNSHWGRDSLWVTKRCPQTHHGVWRPGNQEHDNHYN